MRDEKLKNKTVKQLLLEYKHLTNTKTIVAAHNRGSSYGLRLLNRTLDVFDTLKELRSRPC